MTKTEKVACRNPKEICAQNRKSGLTKHSWPGWIRICRENGPVRSMSRKGCSPDNARCDGFFRRLRIEFFYGCDWSKVTIEEFMGMLNAYLRWYRDARIKSDLDYKSPMQYRRDLGLLAA